MPQFNFANFVPQIAWLALFFAILYFGIVRLTVPKLARVMDEREDKVKGDIAAADTAKTEADRVHDAYEAEMTQAHARAHDAIGEAKASATRATEAKLGEANAALAGKADAAFAALEARRADAMRDIEGVAADAAADIVERLGGTRPDDTTARDAARTALAA